MKSFVPFACLLLMACSKPTPIGNAEGGEASLMNADQVQPLSPGAVPVTIGEGGAAFAACATQGRVVNVGTAPGDGLTLRAAPFDEADRVATLADGAALFVCTRSIDQGWLGVVVPPAAAAGADCGVGGSVAAPRAYAGPCRSGWVASAFVRLVAG